MIKLKIGILGVGHLGKIHVKCIQQIPQYEIIGFYDPNDKNAEIAIAKYGIKRFENVDDLLKAIDVIDIVTPTITHFELAKKAIQQGKHIFIEKPVTKTLEEAKELLDLTKNTSLKIQIGHVERFNPALLSLDDIDMNPMFIEAHRLAMFNPRGTDVSVVLDLMIHDLDILLSLVKSEVKEVRSSGVAVVSSSADIANARIEFENGCVANITASRMSLKQMRKVRLFQKDAYISLDFLDKKSEIVRLYDKGADNVPVDKYLPELQTSNGTKLLHVDIPEVEPVNAIKMELETLAESIQNDTRPKVNLEDGYRALELAHQIMEAM